MILLWEDIPMALVRCEISAGLRPCEVTVGVKDIHGHGQYLRIERDCLSNHDGEWFLTVGLVYDDRQQPWVLIELPFEADSGANRLWVWRKDLLSKNGAGHDPV
jgi:hypothetical protein